MKTMNLSGLLFLIAAAVLSQPAAAQSSPLGRLPSAPPERPVSAEQASAPVPQSPPIQITAPIPQSPAVQTAAPIENEDAQGRAGSFSLLTVPTGLTSTTDLPTCTRHGGFGGGLACGAMLPKGRLALIWDWPGAGGPVRGFRIYRVDGGRHDLIGAQLGTDTTLYIDNPVPKGGYNGACYAVAAYDRDSDGGERPLSARYCVRPDATVQTISLSPVEQFAVLNVRALGEDNIVAQRGLGVGYFYSTDKSVFGDSAARRFWRSGLLFDLSDGLEPGRRSKIRSAKLKLTVDQAWVGNRVVPLSQFGTDGHTSCLAKIGVGVERWWKRRGGWLMSSNVVDVGSAEGPDVSYDLTAVVKKWAEGEPNFGLVLQGPEENRQAFTEKTCMTKYVPEDTRLVIEYE